jgi:hypothetical protein
LSFRGRVPRRADTCFARPLRDSREGLCCCNRPISSVRLPRSRDAFPPPGASLRAIALATTRWPAADVSGRTPSCRGLKELTQSAQATESFRSRARGPCIRRSARLRTDPGGHAGACSPSSLQQCPGSECSVVGSSQDVRDQWPLGFRVMVHVSPVAPGQISFELLVGLTILR